MAKQLMFYEKVVPVSQTRHGKWSVAQDRNSVAFAAGSTAAPLMTAEFLAVATEYPIVFGKTSSGYGPMVVLGIENGRSLFVDEGGAWTGEYVPAFIRRYPFVFAQSEDKSTYTLCIDEDYAGCDPTGEAGEKLYDEDGKPGAYLQRALEFTRNFEVENRRTKEFCKLLEEHDLLDPINAQLVMPDGAKRSLTGLHIVSRERLKKLEGEVLADFFRRDALELIYQHLVSVKNIEKLRKRAVRQTAH